MLRISRQHARVAQRADRQRRVYAAALELFQGNEYTELDNKSGQRKRRRVERGDDLLQGVTHRRVESRRRNERNGHRQWQRRLRQGWFVGLVRALLRWRRLGDQRDGDWLGNRQRELRMRRC